MKTVTHVPEDCQLCPQTKQLGTGVRGLLRSTLQLNFFTPQGVQGGCLSVASRTESSNRTPPQPKGCYPPQGGIFRRPTPGFESAHEFFQFPS